MKALTACLYCNKKKNCPESVGAHSFLDSCFEAEDKSIREAIEPLVELRRITAPVEIYEKVNRIIELIISLKEEAEEKHRKLEKAIRYIGSDNCELVCVHGGEPCNKDTECFCCDSPCVCRDCKECEKFEMDWSKLNET
ncbi:MAG: hypothetical protein IKB08_00365 [Clostridia bacterium]|nr:hypothetical protein [Clostridia bacterium]